MNKAQISKIASPIISAIVAAEKSQVKIGDAVLAAAAKLQEADIKPFCEAVKASLEARGFTPNSAKVTTMYVRRVLTAIIVDGFEPEPGQTLRGLYDSLPKKQTGGAAHARLPNPAADTDADADVAESAPTTLEARAEKVRAAITMIFGYCEPELLDAVQFAAANTAEFIRWAQSASAPAPAPAKRTRKKREPATV